MSFSDLEQKVLEVFITSATDQIYAIKSNIPPEMFGSFGSFFSRNPKDFREHLLDAIYGRIKNYETDEGTENIRWLSKGEFQEPFQAISSGLAKSQDFFKEWYGKYSHKSIANMVWIPMVATNVSQLFARELAYDQLAFFIEQSTRFVKFDVNNMYQDPKIMDSKHKQLYLNTLQSLGEAYLDLFIEAKKFFREEHMPFDKWESLQSEETLKLHKKKQKAIYNRGTKAAALDVARFLLPQAIKTNIAWIVDARSIEYNISGWKGHPLHEIKKSAQLIEKHAGQIAPSLLKYTDENPYYARKLNDYDGDLLIDQPLEKLKKDVNIISYDPDALNKTITHLLKKHNRGGTFEQRYKLVQSMTFNQKIDILKKITSDRDFEPTNIMSNEWVEFDEDFDLTKICFEITTDIGVTRDWRRHQRWDRSEPVYTLDQGYQLPAAMYYVNEFMDDIISEAHEAEIKIRKDFPYEVQYIIPMAAMHAITFSGGLDQLQYLLYTRTTPHGNPSYRRDAFNLAEAALKVHPWLIGYESYPIGKTLKEIYDAAPLKTILNLRLHKTGLHI